MTAAGLVELVIGRIGRAHGLRGDVLVDVRTDDPDRRFYPGAVLTTDPAAAGPLTVARATRRGDRFVVGFEGVSDRHDAEALRGVVLLIDTAALPPLEDPNEFYDHELTGLVVVTMDGTVLGSVEDVLHLPGGDLLSVRRGDGAETLVPFVAKIVPTVDVAGGRVLVDPPAGLLQLATGAPEAAPRNGAPDERPEA